METIRAMAENNLSYPIGEFDKNIELSLENREKNIETIVLAFEELKTNHSNINWELKIVGKIGWKVEKILDTINNSKFKENIIMLGYLSDEDLKSLKDLYITGGRKK